MRLMIIKVTFISKFNHFDISNSVLIAWDCSTEWSLELTQNGAKNIQLAADLQGSRSILLMKEIKEGFTRLVQAERKVLKYPLFTTNVCRKHIRK